MGRLTVGASLENLASIGAFVLDAARNAGLDQRAAYRLRLAVDEMATNVIVHGHPGEHSGDKKIRLGSDMDERSLKITLEDRGPEFNPLTHPLPDDVLSKPTAERSLGGLGVFLALRGVDQFQYERSGNSNRCIFIVNRRAAPGGAA